VRTCPLHRANFAGPTGHVRKGGDSILHTFDRVLRKTYPYAKRIPLFAIVDPEVEAIVAYESTVNMQLGYIGAITTGIQSIILTPTTDNAQLEAKAIASTRYITLSLT
jgi:hypothetical protein